MFAPDPCPNLNLESLRVNRPQRLFISGRGIWGTLKPGPNSAITTMYGCLPCARFPEPVLSLSLGCHNRTNLFSSLVSSESNRLRMLHGKELALVSSHSPRGASPGSSSRHDGGSVQPIALRVEGCDRVGGSPQLP